MQAAALLRIDAYNPRTLCSLGRLQDIGSQFSKRQVLLLAGTELQARKAQPVSKAQSPTHWV